MADQVTKGHYESMIRQAVAQLEGLDMKDVKGVEIERSSYMLCVTVQFV